MSVDTSLEWELIVRCRRGHAASFEPLVREHESRALALAQGLLGDADDAADAVQEAFVRAYRSLGQMKEGHAFGPWFRAIVRNHCLDRLRAPAARTRRAEWSGSVVDAAVWTEPSALASLERAELSGLVRGALDAVSSEHRQILVMKELEELSYAEIGIALGIPEGTVASRLYHARLALRRALAQRGVSEQEAR